MTAFAVQEFAHKSVHYPITGLAMLKILLAAKILPGRTLCVARTDTFVGFVVGMLEVQQAHHQANRQAPSKDADHPAS